MMPKNNYLVNKMQDNLASFLAINNRIDEVIDRLIKLENIIKNGGYDCETNKQNNTNRTNSTS